jgi:type IV pilus assembly protein PilW
MTTSPTASRGFSLTEIMIAMALGMILVTGLLKLLTHTYTVRNTINNVTTLEERAAFALALLQDDVLLAGFWGLHSDGKTITVPAGIHVYCSKRDVSEWALRIAVSIEGDNNSYTLPCPARTSAKMATDTLTLRHASPLPVAPTEDKLQLQISHTRGILFNDGALPVAADDSRSHDLNIHAWYIDEQSSEQGLPGLYRLSLVKGGSMQHQEIMPGVENLQIQFGVDRNTDGIIDGFVEPDEVTDNLIHAVQISIQMRSAHPETGYVNKEPYTDDNYRRLSATRTVWLRNS